LVLVSVRSSLAFVLLAAVLGLGSPDSLRVRARDPPCLAVFGILGMAVSNNRGI
jgi:hypothetical protein